ncbi:Uncharacterized protein APZ42_030723 [Daphnia magna]|uniref:Uncharacterized protein n=1 Tax=Daphnia magna TaxID=35525 RepID=A0A164NHX8_9CRUS|nr:Uncharacterized protein APZ42_030723 [Daphnia magna]
MFPPNAHRMADCPHITCDDGHNHEHNPILRRDTSIGCGRPSPDHPYHVLSGASIL